MTHSLLTLTPAEKSKRIALCQITLRNESPSMDATYASNVLLMTTSSESFGATARSDGALFANRAKCR